MQTILEMMKISPQILRVFRLAHKCVTVLAVMLILQSVSAFAQINSATLSGSVKDTSGAVVQGASVSVLQTATGIVRETVSNEAGLYNVPFLQPGDYKVSITKGGYQTISQTLTLQVNQIANLPFTLTVGSASESIAVTAEAPELQTETSGLGTVINNRVIADLPLNGRQFIQLLQLAPGTVPVSVSQTGVSDLGSSGSNITPSINGQTGRSNLFYVDGLYATDPFFSSLSISPSIDAIQEFQEQTHTDQAQFGGSTGGTVNLVTKGGANTFHGSAYEFFRDNNIAAKRRFGNSNPFYLQNQFGGTVSGPILHNKLFFFGFYDGYRQREASTSRAKVPTAAQLSGDFSALSTTIYDPLTYDPVTKKAQPFTGNKIQGTRLNQGVLAVLKAYVPAPNYTDPDGTGFNLINTAKATTDQNQYSIRVDYNVKPSDLVYGRYSYSKNSNMSPAALPLNPWKSGFEGTNAGGTWVHTFSPSLVAQITAGYNSVNHPQEFGMPNAASVFQASGLSAGFTAFPGGIKVPMLPSLSASNYFGLNGGWGPIGPQHLYQISGSLNKQAGAHALSFGAAYYHTWMYTNWAGNDESFDQEATWNPCGALDSKNNCVGTGGDGLASMLLGLPNGADRQLGNSGVNLYSTVSSAYVQDTWKLHHRITINYGIRWDNTTPVGENDNRFSGFDLHSGKWYIARDNKDMPKGPLPDGVVVLDRNQITHPSYTNFSPRLGISYGITPNTVINAGAGVTFDNWSGALQAAQNARGAWPSGASQNVSGLNTAGVTTGATAQNPFVGLTTDMPSTPFRSGGGFLDTQWKNSYSWQWNLLVQHQFGRFGTGKVSYVGSSSARSPIQVPSNRSTTPGPTKTLPFSNMSQFNTISSVGHMNYNALQAQYQKSYSNGLTITTALTWSKNINVGCADYWEACNIQNPYDLRSNRSVDDVDVPIVVTAAAVYALPFGKGKAFATQGMPSLVFGGWKVNGMLATRSGTPFTPRINFDNANVGSSSMQRPNVSGSTKGPQTVDKWFNTAAFSVSSRYTYGNAGRNSMRGPRYTNVDFSLFREFSFLERYTLELRSEAFNIFNHPNLSNPDATLQDSNFGKITDSGAPRRLQFAGTFRF